MCKETNYNKKRKMFRGQLYNIETFFFSFFFGYTNFLILPCSAWSVASLSICPILANVKSTSAFVKLPPSTTVTISSRIKLRSIKLKLRFRRRRVASLPSVPLPSVPALMLFAVLATAKASAYFAVDKTW